MLNLRKKLLRLQTNFWNALVFFPSVRIRQLENRLEAIKEAEEKAIDDTLERIVQRHKRKELFIKKAKKDYITWKAVVRVKLVEEIGECEICHSRERKLTVDHIIPQKFLKSLGIQPENDRDERNFRLLCELCNGKKGSDFDFTDPRTRYLLIEYLKKLPPEPNPFKKK